MQEQPRRAHRPVSGRVIAGVAAGLADHVHQPVFRVRLVLVIATLFHGAGIGIYLGLWVFLPRANSSDSTFVSRAVKGHRRTEGIQAVALVLIAIGAVVLIQIAGRGVSPTYLVPIAVAALGVMLVWRQFDDQRSDTASSQRSLGAVARIIAGTFLVGMSAVYLISSRRSLGDSLNVLLIAAVALLGMGLVLGPWIVRLVTDLSAERRERIRTQERADVAAHLHDSVLQTLALLQKNAADPGAVATLARRQERELREWLYGSAHNNVKTLSAALGAMAADVENDHHVAIEVVTVSDRPVSEPVSHLLLAAREAMVNAAKHSGAERIDVYAEVTPTLAEVFIRDRGRGFDAGAVPHDRMGVRGSIIDRMHRHRGSADVRSGPGEGTSIRLALPLSDDTSDQEAT